LEAKPEHGSEIPSWCEPLGCAKANTDLCVLGHAFSVFSTQSIKGRTNGLPLLTRNPQLLEIFSLDIFIPCQSVAQDYRNPRTGELYGWFKTNYCCVCKIPLDFCQVQFRQSGDRGPRCTMQACGGLRPEAHEYCEVQRDAGRKKHTKHKAVSFCSSEF